MFPGLRASTRMLAGVPTCSLDDGKELFGLPVRTTDDNRDDHLLVAAPDLHGLPGGTFYDDLADLAGSDTTHCLARR